MSLFLGKIHYWLYDKILWAEKAEEEIIKWAKGMNLPVDKWVQEANEKYGAPTGGRPLDKIIDTSNIHGSLQEKIKSAELRQAAIVTAILNENESYKGSIVKVFENQGSLAAQSCDAYPDSPDGMFNTLQNYLIDGMPCDRVNDVLEQDDNQFIWKASVCLHKPYWEEVGGDVNNFYELREAWTKSFVENLNPNFRFEKTKDADRIFRKGY